MISLIFGRVNVVSIVRFHFNSVNKDLCGTVDKNLKFIVL